MHYIIEVPVATMQLLEELRLDYKEMRIPVEEHDDRFKALIAPHCHAFPMPGETMEIRVQTQLRLGDPISGKAHQRLIVQ